MICLTEIVMDIFKTCFMFYYLLLTDFSLQMQGTFKKITLMAILLK